MNDRADAWEDLTPEQQEGMTEDYWNGLTEDEREALIDTQCVEPGCKNPRWTATGSFYCEQHAREHSLEWAEQEKVDAEL
jgi:hypothetical protein